MVLCKFYAEGCCKYGDQCRFEHVDPYHTYNHRGSDFDRPTGTSVLKSSSTTSSDQQLFGQHNFQTSHQNKPAGSSFNIHDMMQLVSKDVALAEKGNQWLLSCYSPIRDLINIPELIDYSPEELRWECYMAIQNGRLPVYQAIMQQLHSNVSKTNNKLKKKDTAYSLIEKWLREGEAHTQSQQLVPAAGNSDFSSASATQMFTPSIAQPAGISSFSFALPQQQPVSSLPPQQPTPLYMPQPMNYPQQQQQPIGLQPQPATNNVFVGSQVKAQLPQSDILDKSAYSLVEELSQSELDAYRADRFVFGHIPTKPPLREFCG